MGIIGFLMRQLLNNEQLINKLADSKPIRSGAKMIAYILMQTGTISTHKIKSPAEAIELLKKFAKKYQNQIKEAKELKKK